MTESNNESGSPSKAGAVVVVPTSIVEGEQPLQKDYVDNSYWKVDLYNG